MLSKVKKAVRRHHGAIVVTASLVVLILVVKGCFLLDNAISSRWFWTSIASEYKILLDEKGNYVLGPSRESLLVDKSETEINIENMDYRGVEGTGWFINQTDVSMTKYAERPILIEGFATSFSYFPGDTITFKIDTALRKDLLRKLDLHEVCKMQIDLQIYRLGYYKGAGARLMDIVRFTSYAKQNMMHRHSHHFYSTTGGGAENPSRNYLHTQIKCNRIDNSLVDCGNWKETVNWTLSPHDSPLAATTGVYVAIPMVTNQWNCGFSVGESDGVGSQRGLYIPFVVKHPHMKPYFEPSRSSETTFEDKDPRRRIIFRTSDLTWAAYNKYGGWNLYQGPGGSTYTSSDSTPLPSSTSLKKAAASERARSVSYNRPYHNRLPYPLGQAQNFLFGSEYAMIFFLERLGYNVVYISCEDSEILYRNGYFSGEGPSQLRPKEKPVLLSVGHDEYWTADMVLAYAQARDKGSHLAFFSGNEMFWRVVWTKDRAGREGRLVTCNKETIDIRSLTPNTEWTGTFLDPRQQRSGKLFESGLTEIPHRLTGQFFYVNAYRSDPLRVPKNFGRMRFWRNTYVRLKQDNEEEEWQSYAGVLGYEWDASGTTLCSHQRPPGIFAVSSSRYTIKNQLVEDFGARYKGSGEVLHQMTIYRHQPGLLHELDVGKRERLLKDNPTSLVFSAGTVQWSWALSTMHDGDHITGHHFDIDANYSRGARGGLRRFEGTIPPIDPELQQATMNLLADMGCEATSATNLQVESVHKAVTWRTDVSRESLPKSGSKTSLYIDTMLGNQKKPKTSPFPYVSPSSPDDTIAPVSGVHSATLTRPDMSSAHAANAPTNIGNPATAAPSLTVKGTAYDLGGGTISAVEVSFDYGMTWQRAVVKNFGKSYEPANGRAVRWTLRIPIQGHNKENGIDGADQLSVKEMPPVQWGTCRAYLQLPQKALSNLRNGLCKKSAQRSGGGRRGEHVVIISRAVDDSGWIQPVPTEEEVKKMTTVMHKASCSEQLKSVTNNVKMLCFPYCAM